MKIILTFMILSCLTAFSQDKFEVIPLEEFSEAILKVEESIPKNVNYSYNADYLFFETSVITDTSSQFDFSIIANQKTRTLSMQQLKKEVFQNEEIQIVCDPEEKKMFLQEPQNEFFDRKVTDDFKLFLNSSCTAFKSKRGKNMLYRIKFADGARYESCEVTINKLNQIEKYVLFVGKNIATDWESESTIKPRMEVHFHDYNFGKGVNMNKLKSFEDYFINRKTLQPTKAYAFYEIIDLRN